MKVKNIVFTGFMAAILGATGANAAISVASQGYVDTKISGVETSISNVAGDVTDIQTSLSEGGEIASDIAAAQTAADTAQSEVDALEMVVATKANAADVYSKSEADAKFEEQAAATQKLTDAKAYTDTQIKTLTESLGGVGEDGESTGLTGTVAAQGARITALEDKVGDTAVADQIANALTDYATTADLNTTLADYAKQSALDAEEAARIAADNATTEALKGYTKTADLDAGFVSETEMTTFKSENSAAIEAAQQAGEDAASAVEAKLKLLATADVPEECTTTDGSNICVLTMTSAGTFAWTPLTAPVETPAN